MNKILGTVIEVSDARMKFGLARHILDLAASDTTVQVRRSQNLPRDTQR